MFCTKCGKELPDGTKFCTGCGAEQKPVAKPKDEAPDLNDNAFVPTPAPAPEPTPTPEPTPDPAFNPSFGPMNEFKAQLAKEEPKKSGKGKIIAIIIAIIAAIAVIAGLVFSVILPMINDDGDSGSGKKDSEKTEEEEETEEEETTTHNVIFTNTGDEWVDGTGAVAKPLPWQTTAAEPSAETVWATTAPVTTEETTVEIIVTEEITTEEITTPEETTEEITTEEITTPEETDPVEPVGPTFDDIVKESGIDFKPAKFGKSDVMTFVAVYEESGMLEVVEYAYKNDVVSEMKNTVYIDITPYNDAQIAQLEKNAETQFAVYEADFSVVEYGKTDDYLVVTLHFSGLDKLDNVVALADMGLVSGDVEGLISMKQSEKDMLASGAIKK